MNLHPSIPPKGLRLKVVVGLVLILTIVGLSHLGATLWPDYAQFFPPTLLLLLTLVTGFYALMVWRTKWMVAKLFPGQSVPPVRVSDRITVWVSVSLVIVLAVLWTRSILT